MGFAAVVTVMQSADGAPSYSGPTDGILFGGGVLVWCPRNPGTRMVSPEPRNPEIENHGGPPGSVHPATGQVHVG